MWSFDGFHSLRKTAKKGEAMYEMSANANEPQKISLNDLQECLNQRSKFHSDAENEALILHGCLDFLTTNSNNDSTGYIFMSLQSICKNIISNLDKIAELEDVERKLLRKNCTSKE